MSLLEELKDIPIPKWPADFTWPAVPMFDRNKQYCKIRWHYISDSPYFDRDYEFYSEMMEGETEEDVLNRCREIMEGSDFYKNVILLECRKCELPEFMYRYYGCEQKE